MKVKQIENALALLEFFAERQRPATLADVTKHFGWPRSSAFNILSTLAETGYLYEPRQRGAFYPSTRWQKVVADIGEGLPVPEALSRIIRGLAEATGETVWVSAAGGLYAVFLDVVEPDVGVRYAAHAGKRVPIHLTASGQALLSQMPSRDVEVILHKVTFEEAGPNAPTSVEEVRQQLDDGRARGWFRSASNYSPDLGGVSLPIVMDDRIYSVTIAGPLFRVASKEAEHAALMYRAIADELGADHARKTLKNFHVAG